MKILITGYYNRNNYGDDMYHYAFPKIFKNQEIKFNLSNINGDIPLHILLESDIIEDIDQTIINKIIFYDAMPTLQGLQHK